MRLATRRVSAAYDDALAPLDINIAQYFLLRVVGEHQPISLTELGQLAELDRSTIGRNVRVLKRMGLVETGRGDADGREALVMQTPAGRELMVEATRLWRDCKDRIESRLGEDRVAAVTSILELA